MAWTESAEWEHEHVLTHTDMNTYVSDNTEFLKETIALDDAEALTISGNAITIEKSYCVLTPEAGSEDELWNIGMGADGMGQGTIVILRAATDTIITVQDETDAAGDIEIGDDIVLENGKHIALIRGPTNWHLLYSPRDVTFNCNNFQYPNLAEWRPQVEGAHLPASQTDAKVWIPLNFLKVGDEIISYTLKGDAVETNALTLDCKLVRVNLADPITTTDIPGGGITQVDADGNFSTEAVLTDEEDVAISRQYVLEIEGTTAADDTITVIGAEVVVRRI